MMVVIICLFFHLLSCTILAGDGKSVPQHFPWDEEFDLSRSSVSKSQFTTPCSQKLPASSISFTEIRSNGMDYVDKTAFIKKILDLKDKFIFFTRPRGFGKTTFLEMLEQFFLGNKALFKNTHIAEQMPGEWTKYPVIRIDFSAAPAISTRSDIDKFKEFVEKTLSLHAKKLGLDSTFCHNNHNINLFIDNLQRIKGQPVVILIDNYDSVIKKSMNASYGDHTLFKETLTMFYQDLKYLSTIIKLVFITGISRLSLYFLDIGLCPISLDDLTFSKNFSTAMGFTTNEITSNYESSLQKLATQYDMGYTLIIENIKNWYDGYRFSMEDDEIKVINPISIITSLINKEISDYWIRTEITTRSPQIERMRQSNVDCSKFLYYDVKSENLENLYNDELNSSIPLAVLLYNYGYLTILRHNEKSGTVFLGFPNKEIEVAIWNELKHSRIEPREYYPVIKKSYQETDMKHFVRFLNEAVFPNHEAHLKMDEARAIEKILAVLKRSKLSVLGDEMLYGDDTNDLEIVPSSSDSILITISVKYRESAIEAITQLVEFVVSHPTIFRQKVNKFSKDGQANTHLFGINVGSNEEEFRAISDWIILPYRNGKIFMNESQANPNQVFEEFKINLRETMKSWDDTMCKLANDVLIGL